MHLEVTLHIYISKVIHFGSYKQHFTHMFLQESHSLIPILFLEVFFLLEVRIQPAACELRKAYVFPPHLTHTSWCELNQS